MQDGIDPTDSDVIPNGEFCYQVVALRSGEESPKTKGTFGQDLREAPFLPGYKRILCPHWRRTDHGTMRCAYANVEAVVDDDDDLLHEKRAVAYFGTELAFRRVRIPSLALTDEIKICNENMARDDWPDDEAAAR